MEIRAFGEEAGIPAFSMRKPIIDAAGAGDRNIYFDLGDERLTVHGHRPEAEVLVADRRAQSLLPQTR